MCYQWLARAAGVGQGPRAECVWHLRHVGPGECHGAPKCGLCSEIACWTPTGGSSPGAPRLLRSGRRSSTCWSIWCGTATASSARTICLQAVWDGRIVSESTLTSHINAARKAIGDSGEEQRLIRTLARKGFRFIGDVREMQSRMTSRSPTPGIAKTR